MAEWKTGVPPEDGWYWVVDHGYPDLPRVVLCHFRDGFCSFGFEDHESWSGYGLEVETFVADGGHWQGPLTPPEGLPPSPPE